MTSRDSGIDRGADSKTGVIHEDTQLTVGDRPGSFRVGISERWNAIGGVVNGGFLLALCVTAMRENVPFSDPLVVSAHYLKPVVPGPARIDAATIRHGRRSATAQASLFTGRDEAVRAIGTFTDLEPGAPRRVFGDRPPDLPAPDAAMDLFGNDRLPGVTISEQIEYRVPRLPGWREGRPSGQATTEFWMRFKDGTEADTLTLPLLVDAAAPVVLELGALGSSTIELTVHVRAKPTPGWLACRATTRHVIGRYHEEDFQIWDSAGLLVAESRQIALLRN